MSFLSKRRLCLSFALSVCFFILYFLILVGYGWYWEAHSTGGVLFEPKYVQSCFRGIVVDKTDTTFQIQLTHTPVSSVFWGRYYRFEGCVGAHHGDILSFVNDNELELSVGDTVLMVRNHGDVTFKRLGNFVDEPLFNIDTERRIADASSFRCYVLKPNGGSFISDADRWSKLYFGPGPGRGSFYMEWKYDPLTAK